MIIRDMGNGFTAVPIDAVTKNGMHLLNLNTRVEPYNGYWCLIAPNNRAIDNDRGRPYIYHSVEEVAEDVARLVEAREYSTCGG